MSRKLQGLGLAALLALMLNAGPARAQAAEATTKPAIPLRYDISKEVTLNATVESVPSKSSLGQNQQSGFMLQTNSGLVQGSLTPFVLNGKGAISIKPGQMIQVTGVMTTMKNGKQLFVIRTIQVGGRSYAIRNERGFPVEHPGQNASATTESKGGQL
jgi:DNA/RNA endonuclease YhcR with UshA esterase domain